MVSITTVNPGLTGFPGNDYPGSFTGQLNMNTVVYWVRFILTKIGEAADCIWTGPRSKPGASQALL